MKVHPNSRIARLPRPLQPPALVVRNAVRLARPRPAAPSFRWEGDGLATEHYSPFLEDERFAERWSQLEGRWYDLPGWDPRWRLWVLTRLARQCRALSGAYVEFGAYRGGTAYMVLGTADLGSGRRFFLFDTFAGAPREHATEHETARGVVDVFAGHTDTSVERVAALLAEWESNVELCPGDVFETLPRTEVGRIAFCHLDLNVAGPTRRALAYAYQRLQPGAVVVVDDYGWDDYEDLRAVVDAFFDDKPESVVALPTGQAIVTKLPG
jgi:O-methyltransferase